MNMETWCLPCNEPWKDYYNDGFDQDQCPHGCTANGPCDYHATEYGWRHTCGRF